MLNSDLQRQAFIHELTRSSTRTKTLGAQLVKIDDFNLVTRLLKLDDLSSSEVLYLSKPDGGNRPIWHAPPITVAHRAALISGLEDAYFTWAAEFDWCPCCWIVLRQGTDPFADRLVTISQAALRRRAILQILHDSSGPYTGTIDIRHFYRDITPRQVDILLSELGLPPTLTEQICGSLCEIGLPQSSSISDLIARLLLTHLDRFLQDRNIPAVRFADDIWLVGWDDQEVQARSQMVLSHLSMLGFKVNQQKTNVEPPTRRRWLSRGIAWGKLPIEEYDSDSIDADGPDASGYGGSRFSGVPNTGVDWDGIYNCHHGPKGDRLTPGLRRLTLNAIAKHDIRILERDAYDLVRSFPCEAPRIISLVEPDLAFGCWTQLPDRASLESDQLLSLESSPLGKHVLSRVWTREGGPVNRAVRQGFLDSMPRTEEFVERGTGIVSRQPWLDELASAIGLLNGVPGRVTRVAKQGLFRQFPAAELLADAA
jgi:hypothetical protein